jgi:2-polyprenyl-3-methyl-5-hydroxy-6-metoxy-1,4-benzoquinol methylase
MLKSYTSETSLTTKILEARRLYHWHTTRANERVKQNFENMDALEDTLRLRYGLTLEGLDVLDIGTGQQQIQSAWLARKNRVTGIDLDVVAIGWSPWAYLKMWRINGAHRTFKTLARKVLGLDAMYRRALRRELGRSVVNMPVLQMDVINMRFPSNSFDFVYCSSVLQCVPDVTSALREMNRVLVAGGVGYFTVQLYTSETGSLDPRLYSGDRSSIPHWAHLRPDTSRQVAGNAWLNKLRLSEWKRCIHACLPDPVITPSQPDAHALTQLAKALQQNGELKEYALEELVTHELQVSWRKVD